MNRPLKNIWVNVLGDKYFLNLDTHRIFAKYDVYMSGKDQIIKGFDKKTGQWVVVDYFPHNWKRVTKKEAFVECL